MLNLLHSYFGIRGLIRQIDTLGPWPSQDRAPAFELILGRKPGVVGSNPSGPANPRS